jgi:putative NADH-flavin reductase
MEAIGSEPGFREGDVMKLIVLGATGGIGLEIVRQATEQGHSVTAFVRTPGPLAAFKRRVPVIRGDVLDDAELERVMAGHDALLSGFGPRVPIARTDADLLSRFGIALTKAALRARLRRLIVVSTAFLFQDSIMPPTNLVGRLFFPRMVEDATEMESILQKSGLDWTIVRPPRLTNRPLTGKYRVREGHLPGFGFTISRADVADFMIKTVENRGFIGQVVGTSN